MDYAERGQGHPCAVACLEWAIPVGGATVASRSRPVLDLVQEQRAGTTPPERERLQTLVERDELNDLYGSTLCTCCSSACPSFWWKPNKYVGQAGLLQDYRFIVGSHGHATGGRLDKF